MNKPISPEELREWREEFSSRLMSSAISEYCPDEFVRCLDEIERLQRELTELRGSTKLSAFQALDDAYKARMAQTEEELLLLREVADIASRFVPEFKVIQWERREVELRDALAKLKEHRRD